LGQNRPFLSKKGKNTASLRPPEKPVFRQKSGTKKRNLYFVPKNFKGGFLT
jgi:hypothetical protein